MTPDNTTPCACDTKAAVCGRCLYCGRLKEDEMVRRKKAAPEKTAAELRQERIDGTYDPVPEEVQSAADEYVRAKRKTAEWREAMNGRKEALIDAMVSHDVRELDIDDGEKRIVLEDNRVVKIKKKSNAKPGVDSDADEAFAS